MTSPNIAHQRPLGSGFSAFSTADDVLAGVDLTGMDVVITGGHAGIGLETTRALSRAGASLTVGARDPGRARAALGDVRRVEVAPLDLLDPQSIEAFAARFEERARPLHVLINCAGLPAPADVARDARGYEAQFATDHLGHFHLTRSLLPALHRADGSRVVTVTSGAHRFADILWDDPTFQRTPYSPGLAYAQAKTANILFTVELDRRGAPFGLRAFAAHPGVVVGTGLNSASGAESLRADGLIDEEGNPIIDPPRGKKTPQQGASTIVFGAASALLAGIGGVYLKDSDVARLDDEPRPMSALEPPSDAASHALDAESARRLWELSERLIDHPHTGDTR
jgi:NAD(P)-dependent dehydrogenase (short-subunit alcohol dehydrogenase family)